MKTFRKSCKVFLLLTLLSSGAQAAGTVIHPEPKEPLFLSAELYPAFKAKLPSPPLPGSKQQVADEKELLRLQAIRTAAQCARAESEVMVSVSSFFGAPYGNLTATEVKLLSPFFEQVRNDADFFIQKMKKDFPRPRPFLYVAGLKPCVPKEVTGAYPSGHATLAHLYAEILKDLYPTRSKEFLERARMIAEDRVLAGMHHPTDIQAGSKLAKLIYEELKDSNDFKKALNSLKLK